MLTSSNEESVRCACLDMLASPVPASATSASIPPAECLKLGITKLISNMGYTQVNTCVCEQRL